MLHPCFFLWWHYFHTLFLLLITPERTLIIIFQGKPFGTTQGSSSSIRYYVSLSLATQPRVALSVSLL
jgi:hypothetical protein